MKHCPSLILTAAAASLALALLASVIEWQTTTPHQTYGQWARREAAWIRLHCWHPGEW